MTRAWSANDDEQERLAETMADGFRAEINRERLRIARDLRDEAAAARRLGRDDEAENLERLAGRYERGEHR